MVTRALNFWIAIYATASRDSHDTASREQQRQMSKILSGKENSFKPKPKEIAPKENSQAQSSGSAVQGSILAHGIFLGARIGVIKSRILSFLKPLAPIKSREFQLRNGRNVAMLSSPQTKRNSNIVKNLFEIFLKAL